MNDFLPFSGDWAIISGHTVGVPALRKNMQNHPEHIFQL
jgi:hypothetical protein